MTSEAYTNNEFVRLIFRDRGKENLAFHLHHIELKMLTVQYILLIILFPSNKSAAHFVRRRHFKNEVFSLVFTRGIALPSVNQNAVTPKKRKERMMATCQGVYK